MMLKSIMNNLFMRDWLKSLRPSCTPILNRVFSKSCNMVNTHYMHFHAKVLLDLQNKSENFVYFFSNLLVFCYIPSYFFHFLLSFFFFSFNFFSFNPPSFNHFLMQLGTIELIFMNG